MLGTAGKLDSPPAVDDDLMVVVTRQDDADSAVEPGLDATDLAGTIDQVVLPNPCPETLERDHTAPSVVPVPRAESDLVEDLIFIPPAAEAATPESAEDAALEEQPSTKQGVGHRDHAAFRAVRRAVVIGDVICALLVLVPVALLTQGAVWVMPAAWLATALLRTSQSDRMADLLDRRPFLKMNSHLAFGVVILAVTFGRQWTTREVLMASAVLTIGGLAVRTIVRRRVNRGRGTMQVCETVLVVGSLQSVRRTINEWRDLPNIDVVGACLGSSDPEVTDVEGVPVLGRVTEVESVAGQLGADIVALHDIEHLGGLRLARLQYALEETGTQLSVITPVTNMRVDRGSVRLLGRRVVLDISYGKPGGLARVIKTAVDQVLSLLLIVLTLPLMLAAGILVRLTSRGPAIFKQVRVGEGGTTFVMYKLRTMHQDAEARLEALLDQNEVGGGLFKMADDPRMTAVGRWLRKFSIDELPQLFNVLKGEMSLIGPRPALPREVQTYDDAARRRLAVKPGITGLWQVSGRSNLTWDQSVRIDSDYVDNWRPARELSIAMLTIKALVTRDGAH